MDEKATQDARLVYLVEEFKADSVQYKDLKMPKDTEGKRRILRSLMNIRMPRKMADYPSKTARMIFEDLKKDNPDLFQVGQRVCIRRCFWEHSDPYDEVFKS